MYGHHTKRHTTTWLSKGAAYRDGMKMRVLRTANIFMTTGGTVRSVAKTMGVSKSTTHKDLTDRLLCYDPTLASAVREQLDRNAELRAVRGGEATRLRFLFLKTQA